MGTWAGICDDAMRRAIRGVAAVACVYGGGFGDRRVFSLASGDARTRVGGKLALVFPGERGTPFSGCSKAKSGSTPHPVSPGWWLHDLRQTLATGLQRLGVRLEVNEAVLNHLSGSRAGVVGIYQRHDWIEEKRSALDAWSAHLIAAAQGNLVAGKVLPCRRTYEAPPFGQPLLPRDAARFDGQDSSRLTII
jgi:hypothetical protein